MSLFGPKSSRKAEPKIDSRAIFHRRQKSASVSIGKSMTNGAMAGSPSTLIMPDPGRPTQAPAQELGPQSHAANGNAEKPFGRAMTGHARADEALLGFFCSA